MASSKRSQLSARAGSFGAGNEVEAVACLLAFLRWTSWTPAIFYSQVLHAAFTSISQCGPTGSDAGAFFLWRAFLVGRVRIGTVLPSLHLTQCALAAEAPCRVRKCLRKRRRFKGRLGKWVIL